MEGPRAPLESELPEVIQFFSQQLRPGQAWSIADEYPLAMTSANLANFRVVKDGGKILSGAVSKNLLIRNPIGIFKVAGIGSVVTHPQHRNQGLSQTVLESSIQLATEQGCDFAILWTDLFDFYRKLGFEVAGKEISLLINSELAVPASGIKVLQTNRIAPEALLKLYTKHTTGTIRTIEEVRRYLTIPNSRLYTAWDVNNNILAYAVEGKGADLQSYIHEWGGDVSPLIQLVAHIRKEQNRPLTMIAPEHAGNLIRRMQQLGVQTNEGILGMIKILNYENLMFKIKRHARHLGIDDFVFEFRDQAFYIGTGANVCRTDATSDLIRMIFGPLTAKEVPAFDAHTQEVISRILPIPMWVWGWDSV